MKEILKLIHDGGLLSKQDIADRMGIQESALDNVFSLLSSKGYLQKIAGNVEASRACIGCSMNKDCMQKISFGTVYVVTEKGKTYLESG